MSTLVTLVVVVHFMHAIAMLLILYSQALTRQTMRTLAERVTRLAERVTNIETGVQKIQVGVEVVPVESELDGDGQPVPQRRDS